MKGREYLLGVDGGNTKTLYLLSDTEGNILDRLETGTCSHEAVEGSFEGSRRELSRQLGELFGRNDIGIGDVAFSVFGLAGADFPRQKEKLAEIIRALGFHDFIVDNDGFLGLKAGSPDGTGICSINGTGTVTVGINRAGGRLQIGGLGGLSSDRAGAGYIAERGASLIYDMLFRLGKETCLKDLFFEAFGVADDNDFPLAATDALRTKEGVLLLNKLMERAEECGDAEVIAALKEIGRSLAFGVLGCARRLGMRGRIPVVLAGSVWTKGGFCVMGSAFSEVLASERGCTFDCTILKQPPAEGAVLWALEEYRRRASAAC